MTHDIDELTLHIEDATIESGMRSLRWYGAEDVTEEYIS